MLEHTEVGLEYDLRHATCVHPEIASAIGKRAHQRKVNGVRRTDGEEQVESRERSEWNGHMYIAGAYLTTSSLPDTVPSGSPDTDSGRKRT